LYQLYEAAKIAIMKRGMSSIAPDCANMADEAVLLIIADGIILSQATFLV
jgi:hypothetical protein